MRTKFFAKQIIAKFVHFFFREIVGYFAVFLSKKNPKNSFLQKKFANMKENFREISHMFSLAGNLKCD